MTEYIVHSVDKPYSICTVCSKSFASSSNMTNHTQRLYSIDMYCYSYQFGFIKIHSTVWLTCVFTIYLLKETIERYKRLRSCVYLGGGGITSTSFNVTNGVRQLKVVYSPPIYSVYIWMILAVIWYNVTLVAW